MGNTFTDLAVTADSEGIYDLTVDPVSRDFKLTEGLESASFVSIFSDRRARADEVADPMKRRGWIGNLVSDVPGDNFGSGLWLYEQARLTPDILAGLRFELEQSHDWMIDDGLAKYVIATVSADAASRTLMGQIEIVEPDGAITTHAYPLIQATKVGLAGSN